jgi:tRNA-dihydrouridine synthase C
VRNRIHSVNDQLLTPAYFHKFGPELLNGARTVPVCRCVQLLGSDPVCLAENAALACELGSEVIDLNFGCPAKTVNKSRGGAVLLKEPELLNHRRTCASRRAGAHPGHRQDAPGLRQPGWLAGVRHGAGRRRRRAHRGACTDQGRRLQAASALGVDSAGAGRGQGAGVRQWRYLERRRLAPLPRISGVEDIMLGRGLVSRPDLARQIAAARAGEEVVEMSWAELLPLIQDFWLQAKAQMTRANRRAV